MSKKSSASDANLEINQKEEVVKRAELLQSIGVVEYFYEGSIWIDEKTCKGRECMLCIEACPTNALYWKMGKIGVINELCIFCTACVWNCIVDNCVQVNRKRINGEVEKFGTPMDVLTLFWNNKIRKWEEMLKVVNLKKNLSVDLTIGSCNSCRNCEVMCAITKKKSLGGIRVVTFEPGIQLPIFCNQCGLCISLCPKNAFERDVNEAIIINEEKCDGCGICITACPYEVVFLDPETRKPVKCDLCSGDPPCVTHCQALIYADINEADLRRDTEELLKRWARKKADIFLKGKVGEDVREKILDAFESIEKKNKKPAH